MSRWSSFTRSSAAGELICTTAYPWCSWRSRAWYREFGFGARTEIEFCERFEEYAAKDPLHDYASLMREMPPEGRALVRAHALELWWRIMPPLLRWEASQQLRRAEAAVHAITEERNRVRREGGYSKVDVLSRDFLANVAA